MVWWTARWTPWTDTWGDTQVEGEGGSRCQVSYRYASYDNFCEENVVKVENLNYKLNFDFDHN